MRDFPAAKMCHLSALPPGAVFLLRVRPESGFMSEHMATDVEVRLDVPLSNSTSRLDFILAWNGKLKVYEYFAERQP